MASRLGVYYNMNALRLCRPRMAGTRFIRPALFWRTMFEGGPTLGGENDSTVRKRNQHRSGKGKTSTRRLGKFVTISVYDGCC